MVKCLPFLTACLSSINVILLITCHSCHFPCLFNVIQLLIKMSNFNALLSGAAHLDVILMSILTFHCHHVSCADHMTYTPLSITHQLYCVITHASTLLRYHSRISSTALSLTHQLYCVSLLQYLSCSISMTMMSLWQAI